MHAYCIHSQIAIANASNQVERFIDTDIYVYNAILTLFTRLLNDQLNKCILIYNNLRRYRDEIPKKPTNKQTEKTGFDESKINFFLDVMHRKINSVDSIQQDNSIAICKY